MHNFICRLKSGWEEVQQCEFQDKIPFWESLSLDDEKNGGVITMITISSYSPHLTRSWAERYFGDGFKVELFEKC